MYGGVGEYLSFWFSYFILLSWGCIGRGLMFVLYIMCTDTSYRYFLRCFGNMYWYWSCVFFCVFFIQTLSNVSFQGECSGNYIVTFCASEHTLRSGHIWLNEWLALHSAFLTAHQSGVLQRCLVVTWLVSPKTAAVPVHVLFTPYNHAPVYSVTLFKAVRCLCV